MDGAKLGRSHGPDGGASVPESGEAHRPDRHRRIAYWASDPERSDIRVGKAGTGGLCESAQSASGYDLRRGGGAGLQPAHGGFLGGAGRSRAFRAADRGQCRKVAPLGLRCRNSDQRYSRRLQHAADPAARRGARACRARAAAGGACARSDRAIRHPDRARAAPDRALGLARAGRRCSPGLFRLDRGDVPVSSDATPSGRPRLRLVPPTPPPLHDEANAPAQREMPFAIVEGEPITQLPRDLYIPPHALEAFLEAFEGPLDLLLYLIRRQNLDILDIPIAEISRQYVQYIELMKELQFELVG